MIQNDQNLYVDAIVDIDGNAFKNCIFRGCKLRFSGTAPVSFDGCQFDNSGFELAGFAALTMSFLKALYHGFGDAGPKLVEPLFEEVRMAPQAESEEKIEGDQSE